jgi:hypothetical protein
LRHRDGKRKPLVMPEHPRRTLVAARKAWMAGTKPGHDCGNNDYSRQFVIGLLRG